MDWSWFLPDPVSTFGGEIDTLYYWILGITGFIFVVTEAVLVWFVFRYRHKEGRRAHYSHGNKRLEIVWTVIPFLIVVGISWASTEVWMEVKAADRVPAVEADLPLRVAAKQFEWNVTYPGPDGEFDTGDEFVKRNQLHIPVGRTVRIDLTSEDVIHSFFLPDFRVKQDAVPGMVIPVWFQATETGEYPLACAELCGLGHYRMRAQVTVHEVEEFERWLATETGAAGVEPGTAPAPADTARIETGQGDGDGEAASAPAGDEDSGKGGDRA
ncbi:MAG: cytochrome c oxidase subunit II [Gemmatimonadota bacterium]|nr:cytochrome c oxidase subunit II [Gemmatimonadota bacterium]